MSVYQTILNAVQSAVVGLGLSGISDTQVAVRKLPKVDEQIDTLPLICVVPKDEPEKVTKLSFEDMLITYPVEIVVIAAGNMDFSTNLDTYLDWREQIRKAFQEPTLAGAGTVINAWVVPELVIDRAAVAQQYDYQGMSIKFDSHEPIN